MLLASAALLSLLLMVPSSADADGSGVCGDSAVWTIDGSGTLVVSGSGPMHDYPSGDAPWSSFATTVKAIEVKPGITSVGDRAFEGCHPTTLALPSSVEEVGDRAFAGCAILIVANLPSVCVLGDGAFEGCTMLMTVSIPSAASVGERAFAGCTALMTIAWQSVEDIGAHAFDGCSSLSSVTIPASASSIGDGAFDGCSILSSISVNSQNPVYSSLDGVLMDRSGSVLLKFPAGKEGAYTIPSSVVRVSAGAFIGCVSSLGIPSTVSVVEEGAFDVPFYNFDGRSLLDEQEIPGYIYKGSAGAYVREIQPGTKVSSGGLVYTLLSSSPLSASLSGYEKAPKSISVPSAVDFMGVTVPVMSVSASAFKGCASLKSVHIGDVETIGMKAFARCTGLTEFTGGPNLKTVGAYALYGCSYLATVDFEESAHTLKTIGKYAFHGCNRITSIAFPSGLKTIDDSAFTIQFTNEKHSYISSTLKNLAGYSFHKDTSHYYYSGYLTRDPSPVGTEVAIGSVHYKITSYLPAEAEAIWCSENARVLDVLDIVAFEGREYNVVKVADGAFSGRVSLKYVDLHGIPEIGTKAFYGCSGLKDVMMDSVEIIGMKAFAQCSGIRELDFGNSLRTVGNYAFYGCSSLSDLEFPDSVSRIGAYAFSRCGSIEEVAFGTGLASIGTAAFGDLVFVDSEGQVGDAERLSGKVFSGSDGALMEKGLTHPMVQVHFRVATDSTGLGKVSAAAGELTDYLEVPYGTTVSIVNGKVILSDGSNSTPKAGEKSGYTVSFVQWNGADDMNTPTVSVITEETWFWAHFTTRGMPVQVEVKYLSGGAPIQIDGKKLDWVTASYFGNDVSIDYKQNFSAEVAKKLDAAYKLTKGVIAMPGHTDTDPALGVVAYKNVDAQRIIIQFEFSKNATYILRNMVYADGTSLPFLTAEMPEAYGLDATVTVTATDANDIGKTAKVRIGDATGTFYGVGQTGTYNGHSYTVVKGDSGISSDVKVLIDGEINVCSKDKPLLFYYQFV